MNPVPNVMYGLTHDRESGAAIIREPRVLKVGIGLPKGRAVSIYIHRGEWLIRYGVLGDNKLTMKTVAKFKTRAEAQAYHAANKHMAAMSNRPQKLPFFTFASRSVVEENGKLVEIFEPDFAAIEAHGETPTEVDIVLMSENPFNGGYQMWSASELKCKGDGVNALRVLSLGNAQMPGWNEAKSKGEKFFSVQPCWLDGCPYAADGKCKPGVTMNFQLANSMRLGATAYFHTTSIRSTWQLFSSLQTIQQSALRVGSTVIGLPVKMTLTPFRSNHNGMPALQYGVSLELRAEDMQALKRRFMESAWQPRQITAAQPVIEITSDDMTAASVTDEFYPDASLDSPETFDDEEPQDYQANSSTAANKTFDKTTNLANKLKFARAASAPPQDPEAEPVQEDTF